MHDARVRGSARTGTVRLWLTGLRPRTLPASVAPVAVGASAAWTALLQRAPACPLVFPEPEYCAVEASAYAALVSRFWPVALLCAGVALFLQIAVNFANDYSDGIRGTDAGRGDVESRTAKPQRLTASGLVPPHAVLAAAGMAAGLACLCGLAAVLVTRQWWLVAVGAAGLVAGWFYTGGRRPYGYAGFGELGVFLFFGLAAVLGTEAALARTVTVPGALGAVIAGLFACAMLMVNNLRDVDEDRLHAKRTLAVRLGERRARALLLTVHAVATLPVAVASWIPLAMQVRRWVAPACGTAMSVPACPAGAASCSTDAVASVSCEASVPPSPATVALAAFGLLLAAVGVAFVRAVRSRSHGRALALSGAGSLLFAACAVCVACAAWSATV